MVALALALAQSLLTAQAPDVAALSQRASAAMKARDYKTAEGIYRQLRELLPEEPGIALNLGLALYSSGQHSPAVGQLNRFLEVHPNHASALLLVGICYQKLDRPSDAVQPLQRAADLDPGNDRIRLELGDALLRVLQPERALEEFRELARRDRTNPRAWLGLGLSYIALSTRAAEDLRSGFHRSPYGHLLSAHAAQARGRFRAAFAQYRAAQAIDPDMAGVHDEVALVYEALGHPEWAAAERAKRRDPKPCDQRVYECWFDSGDFASILVESEQIETPESLYWRARALGELARQAHDRILALPPSASAFRLIGSFEDLAGRPKDAVEAWKRATQLDPRNPQIHRNLLRSLQAAGMHEESIRASRALLVLRPDSAIARYYQGDALLQTGRAEEAIELLEQAVALSPADTNTRVSLATAYLAIGRGPEAIPHLDVALRAGDDERLLFQLSRAYQSAGRPADAKSALERRRSLVAGRAAVSVPDEVSPP